MLHWAQDTFALDKIKFAKLELAVKPLKEAGALLQVLKNSLEYYSELS